MTIFAFKIDTAPKLFYLGGAPCIPIAYEVNICISMLCGRWIIFTILTDPTDEG